jgi:hypothetical protein
MCRHCLEIDSDHNVLVRDICPRLKKIARFQEGKARWNLEKFYAQWEKVQDILEQCFPNIVARGPLLPSKNNSESLHPWSRNSCPDDRYPELKICLITDFILLRIHTSSVCNNTLHDLTLTKLTVARFVGTGRFWIRYSNDHTKWTLRLL